MSDPRAKAERSAAKDKRQQAAPNKPSTGKKRKSKKPFWFEVTWKRHIFPMDMVFKSRYKTLKAAEQGREAAVKYGHWSDVSEVHCDNEVIK